MHTESDMSKNEMYYKSVVSKGSIKLAFFCSIGMI